MPSPPLLSTWDLQHSTNEEPHTLIRVKNLSPPHALPLGVDAWSRRGKLQPTLISCSISLRRPFSSSADTDTVAASTVHYGVLAKEILEACRRWEQVCRKDGGEEGMGVTGLMRFIMWWLLGGKGASEGLMERRFGGLRCDREEKPVLRADAISMMEIEVMLPKASLLGSGISLKGAFTFGGGSASTGAQSSNVIPASQDNEMPGEDESLTAYSMKLVLEGLRVPSIIGVNDNERLAKQLVVATVEIDRWVRMEDEYCELEELITKTISESSYQTLEALASHISTRLIRYMLLPPYQQHQATQRQLQSSSQPSEDPLHHNHSTKYTHPNIRIRLEKPTAVTFADTPVVEMMVESEREVKEWEELCKGRMVVKPPFPLQGLLNDWIAAQTSEAHEERRGDALRSRR